jgi:hypothetical protein
MNGLALWWRAHRNKLEHQFNTETGAGHIIQRYNPITGTVVVRLSQFGHVRGYNYLKNLAKYKEVYGDDIKVLALKRDT